MNTCAMHTNALCFFFQKLSPTANKHSPLQMCHDLTAWEECIESHNFLVQWKQIQMQQKGLNICITNTDVHICLSLFWTASVYIIKAAGKRAHIVLVAVCSWVISQCLFSQQIRRLSCEEQQSWFKISKNEKKKREANQSWKLNKV